MGQDTAGGGRCFFFLRRAVLPRATHQPEVGDGEGHSGLAVSSLQSRAAAARALHQPQAGGGGTDAVWKLRGALHHRS